MQLEAVEVEAEVGVRTTAGEVVEHDADRLLRHAPLGAERDRDVQPVNDDVVQGAGLAAAGWLPLVQYIAAQVGDQGLDGKRRVLSREVVGEASEVEAALLQLGLELLHR